MKNFICSILLLSALLCFSSNSAYADCPDCTATFTSPEPEEMYIGGFGCPKLVKFNVKYCDDGSHIIDIIEVTTSSSTCTESEDFVVEKAIDEILFRLGAFVNEDPWPAEVKISTPKCLEKTSSGGGLIGGGNTTYEECDPTNGECCYNDYVATSNFVNSVTYSSSSTFSCLGGCEDVCDAHANINTGWVYQPNYSPCFGTWDSAEGDQISKTFTDCELKINYTQFKTSGKHSFYLTSVQAKDKNASSTCTITQNTAIQEALEAIIAKMGPGAPGDSLVGGLPGCWDNFIIDETTVFDNCDPNNCCMVTYKFNNSGGGITLTDQNISTTATNNCNVSPLSCDYICDMNDIFINESSTLSKLRSQEIQNGTNLDLDVVTSLLELYPNPAEGLIKIDFRSNLEGQLKIEIFDINATMLSEFREEKSTYVYNKEININNYNSGMYLVKISIDGMEVISNKFIKK